MIWLLGYAVAAGGAYCATMLYNDVPIDAIDPMRVAKVSMIGASAGTCAVEVVNFATGEIAANKATLKKLMDIEKKLSSLYSELQDASSSGVSSSDDVNQDNAGCEAISYDVSSIDGGEFLVA